MDTTGQTLRLAVQSDTQRTALLCGCSEVLDLEHDAPDSGRIAEAETLEGELDDGRAMVSVGLGIAGQLEQAIAEQIEREACAVVEANCTTPVGVHVRRTAALTRMLVALDAAVERELMPA